MTTIHYTDNSGKVRHEDFRKFAMRHNKKLREATNMKSKSIAKHTPTQLAKAEGNPE